ncbi:hypothetical protein B296_00045484 [Ensete ventricosum]|uniref:Uncharacterized protein n=1 Tax=Ensete ventricosum TaxID=4639 RepID=A0A426YCZ8_ENSVE|nr:hypothetical protein B296_00045484 [Ensete ventricosum]
MRKKENDLHQEDDSITSSSLSKRNLNANQQTKEKGSRFNALPKGSNVVYNIAR